MQYMENSSTEYTYSIRNPFKFPEKNPPVNPKEETVSDASALFGALFFWIACTLLLMSAVAISDDVAAMRMGWMDGRIG